jgi:hypothetical protein
MPAKWPKECELTALGGSNPPRSSSQSGFSAALPRPDGKFQKLRPASCRTLAVLGR